MTKTTLYPVVLSFLVLLAAGTVFAQEREDYLIGDEQKLEMIVHIWGEVSKPGEYRVPDQTNVLQLISKAGGTTELSKLGDVRITRIYGNAALKGNGLSDNSRTNGITEPRIIKVNLDDYLQKEHAAPLPILKPGDVVVVSRNSLSTWKNIMGFARDLSVIASVIFIAVRTTKE